MTSTELTAPASKIQYAQALASASLLPRAYQKQPANVLLAMEYGEALGIPPIQAIQSVHVIEGKPSASADLIASLVRRAGHKLRVTGDDQSATAVIIRADDPDFEFTATWDMARAKQAGLTGKGVWKQYPAAMLKARAITEVARAGAGDALFGVIYTPEELERGESHVPTDLGNVAAVEVVDVPSADEAPEPSPLEKAVAAMTEAGVETDQMLDYARAVTGRDDLASAADLTDDEIQAVTLSAIMRATPEMISRERRQAAADAERQAS